MPIERRDSHTWKAESSRDEAYVLGDENTVIGQDTDDASKLVKLLVGDPIKEIVRVEATTATVKKASSTNVSLGG